jgi:acyl-[acyl-carrier-protein] desaturase
VMRGYRGDKLTQIETLVFMAFLESAYAVYMRNLEAKITEPVLKGLVGRIAKDEERHEDFFRNLVNHCLEEYSRDSTINSIARRAGAFGIIGGDILEYQDKLTNVARAGIFDIDTARTVVSDSIKHWGLADEPVLKKFVLA